MINRFIGVLAVAVLAVSGTAPSWGSDEITTYGLVNEADVAEKNVPVTFGAVFAPGDVPAGETVEAADGSGKPVPLQVDVKAKNPDGSLRHAVVTTVLPGLAAHDQANIALRATARIPPAGRSVALSDLPEKIDANVTLGIPGHNLTASLRQALTGSKPIVWLNGPLVSEWIFSVPFRDATGKPDPQLTARFGVRSYGKGRPVRIEVIVENGWTFVPKPRDVGYDAQISIGGRNVFSQARMVQYSHSRWRKVFWWNDAPDVYVKPDMNYLKKARVVSNYEPGLKIPEKTIAKLYEDYQSKDNGPLGASIVTKYMPMTGGRIDIGPLPRYTVVWLLTMDPRAYAIVKTVGDLSGSWPVHYRNEKTDRPVTVEEYPQISDHINMRGAGPTPLPDVDQAGFPKPPLHPDPAHQPSIAFIPYLVTGDYYYLEELQFWTQWNVFGTAPHNRGFEKGFVKWGQVRGQAWSLRTLAQAAFITPDSDPLKGTLLRELKANIDWYNQNYANNPTANKLHFALEPSKSFKEVSPWQDDFLTWAAGYMVGLGFADAEAFFRWKAVYPTQRMINPDYCWILASAYRMEVQRPDFTYVDTWKEAYDLTFRKFAKNGADPDSTPCNSDSMMAAFKLHKLDEMIGHSKSVEGFPANMQPGLAAAVDSGIPGAKEAWERFQNRALQPNYATGPEWDVVPWSVK